MAGTVLCSLVSALPSLVILALYFLLRMPKRRPEKEIEEHGLPDLEERMGATTITTTDDILDTLDALVGYFDPLAVLNHRVQIQGDF